jgi:hypothetical protein
LATSALQGSNAMSEIAKLLPLIIVTLVIVFKVKLTRR